MLRLSAIAAFLFLAAVAVPQALATGTTGVYYPTSLQEPKGKPVTKLGVKPYQRNAYNALVKLMKLSDDQYRKFIELRSAGMCVEREFIPQGTVLDGMTFGENEYREFLEVTLDDPTQGRSLVCDLGDGIFVVWFYRCKNYALIRNRSFQFAAAPQESSCFLQELPPTTKYEDSPSVYTGNYGNYYGWMYGLPGTHVDVPDMTITEKQWIRICPPNSQ